MKKSLKICAFFVIILVLPFCLSACDFENGSTVNHQQAINLATRSCVVIETSGASNGISGNAGTGVIYHIDQNDLYIMTNWHVICKNIGENVSVPASTILVSAANTKTWEGNTDAESYQTLPQYWLTARVLGGSVKEDVAILKVTVPEDNDYLQRFALVPAKISYNSETIYGESVFAIGNSIGMGLAASEGVISSVAGSEYCLGNDLTGISSAGVLRRMIRTTAAVQQGNSGGGLFNEQAQLIGLVQSKVNYYGYEEDDPKWSGYPADNIAYAVPASVAVRIARQIVSRHLANLIDTNQSLDNLIVPDLGIRYKGENLTLSVDPDGNNCYFEDVTVTSVLTNNLGLRPGDILLSATCNDKTVKITRAYMLQDFLLDCWNQTEISLTVARDGSLKTLTGKLAYN